MSPSGCTGRECTERVRPRGMVAVARAAVAAAMPEVATAAAVTAGVPAGATEEGARGVVRAAEMVGVRAVEGSLEATEGVATVAAVVAEAAEARAAKREADQAGAWVGRAMEVKAGHQGAVAAVVRAAEHPAESQGAKGGTGAVG